MPIGNICAFVVQLARRARKTVAGNSLLNLEQKLKNKTAIIGIVGLGYVGLPLAVAFSQAAFKVLGFDMQQKRVGLVNKGQPYIADIDGKGQVIDAASSKPFGYMPFYPGPGIGGHCIPLDPYYLASKAREYDFHTKFIELAAEINEGMPYYVTSRIMDALNTRVLVLGAAYKKDVEDVRESPSVKLIQLLREKGASVRYNRGVQEYRVLPFCLSEYALDSYSFTFFSHMSDDSSPSQSSNLGSVVSRRGKLL